MSAETKINIPQLKGLVKERNAYLKLLKASEYALGVLRDTPINEGQIRGETTRSLAEKIRLTLKGFETE